MTPTSSQSKNWRPGTEKFLGNYASEHNPEILHSQLAAEDPQSGQQVLISCEIPVDAFVKLMTESNEATVKVVGTIPFEIQESKRPQLYRQRAA